MSVFDILILAYHIFFNISRSFRVVYQIFSWIDKGASEILIKFFFQNQTFYVFSKDARQIRIRSDHVLVD